MDLEATSRRLEGLIRNIPDFPQPGVMFKDITPMLQDPRGLHDAVEAMIEPFRDKRVDVIVGLESRGFLFGAPMAYVMGLGFVLIRKSGKLPGEKIHIAYDLEYGTDTLEIHNDALKPGQRALLVDDLLATGGTMSASTALVKRLGAEIVGISFLIELDFLKGRERLTEYDVHTVIHV